MPHPNLSADDLRSAQEAMAHAIAELATRGVNGDELQRHAMEIGTAMRAGLVALSDSSASGSTQPASRGPQ